MSEAPGDEGWLLSQETFSGSDPSISSGASEQIVPDDPSAGAVLLCRRIAQVPLGQALELEHWWLLTRDREAGMGKCGDGVPGARSDSPYATETCVNDHSGEHLKPGVRCAPLDVTDEGCVDRELTLDRDLGVWTLTNQCQTFVRTVLDACKSAGTLIEGAEGAPGQ